jgi:oxygen-independent coproporphyrinogen-3 oxidase
MPYKGFGISAQSKSSEGISYNIGKNGESLNDCLKFGTFFSQDTYILPTSELLGKYVAISGYLGYIDIAIATQIDKNFEQHFADEIDFLLSNQFITIHHKRIDITQKGYKHYGAVLALFYPKEVKHSLLVSS